mmetsp:Transcript_12181/g.32864  ORF Transcript_12181/g.32864 Transcript_12181/m.32864 type:complete len:225 (-) Transcript_12181:786-1460(-)
MACPLGARRRQRTATRRAGRAGRARAKAWPRSWRRCHAIQQFLGPLAQRAGYAAPILRPAGRGVCAIVVISAAANHQAQCVAEFPKPAEAHVVLARLTCLVGRAAKVHEKLLNSALDVVVDAVALKSVPIAAVVESRHQGAMQRRDGVPVFPPSALQCSDLLRPSGAGSSAVSKAMCLAVVIGPHLGEHFNEQLQRSYAQRMQVEAVQILVAQSGMQRQLGATV